MLLAAHAAASGWKVIVGHKDNLNGSPRDLPRGLYFDKSIQSLALGLIKHIKALGNTYAANDEEGLVHEGGPSAYVKRRCNAQTLAETRSFCTWGEAQAEVIRAAEPTLADRLAVTGNPRVDLWRPEMHAQPWPPATAWCCDRRSRIMRHRDRGCRRDGAARRAP